MSSDEGNSETESRSDSALLRLAIERGWLTEEDFDRLLASGNRSLTDLAVEQDLLTTAQVETLLPLSTPTTFLPGYEFRELLGEGATGTVYLASQSKLERDVAVKLWKVGARENDIVSARSRLEARIGAQLHHPHIVSVFDYGIERQQVYLAMELVDGETLQERIDREQAFPIPLALQILQQAVSALEYAADLGFVHRDIKPANLMLTRTIPGVTLPNECPAVKVTDFGLAGQTYAADQTRLTVPGAMLGTPSYVAPEQVQNSQVDFRADIYALGATLLHMLTGRQPFAGENAFMALAAKLQGDQSWRAVADSLPESVRSLLLRMTEHDPDARYTSYAELQADLDRLLNDASNDTTSPQGTTSRSVSVTERTPQPGRKWLVWMLGTVGFAALVLIAVPLFRPNVPVPQLVETRAVSMIPLFDGQGLPTGRQRGTWVIGTDEELAPVLEATGGQKLIRVPEAIADGSDFYRLQFGINPLSATVDVCFAIAADNTCRVVRLTDGFAFRGRGSLDDEQFTPDDVPPIVLSAASEGPIYQMLTIERQPGGWFIAINGESWSGVSASKGNTDSVLLRVADGTAHFGRLIATKTAPVTNDRDGAEN